MKSLVPFVLYHKISQCCDSGNEFVLLLHCVLRGNRKSIRTLRLEDNAIVAAIINS